MLYEKMENFNIKPTPKVAVLHDIVAVGKSGMMNILPILSVFGLEACPIPTMLLSTHTAYKDPIISIPQGYILGALEHYKNLNVKFDTILIGYMGRNRIVSEVIEFVRFFKEKYNTKVILDPIFADNGKIYGNIEKNYENNIKLLLKYTDLILPNITEAQYLSGMKNVKDIGNKLTEYGCDVIITGSEIFDNEMEIYSVVNSNHKIHRYTRFNDNFHGTGDTFTGLITALVMNNIDVNDAIKYTHKIIYEIILDTSKYKYDKKEGILLDKNIDKLFNLRKEVLQTI